MVSVIVGVIATITPRLRHVEVIYSGHILTVRTRFGFWPHPPGANFQPTVKWIH